jgi:CRP-like cAMP-binding protein
MAVLCGNCVGCSTRPRSVMSDIPDEILNELNGLKVTNVYKKGQTIFYEGNKPYGVYCLKGGKVKLYKTTAEGKTYIVRLTDSGSLLGYRYFFTDELYGSSAETIEDTTVCFIDKEKFLDLLKKYPPFSMKLLAMMGNEIKDAEQTAASLAYSSINERIVAMILHLKDTFGIKTVDNSFKIDVLLSRNDLASLIGTTTETIVRAMAWLKEKQFVKTENKFLYITDLQGLQGLLPQF